MIAVSARSGHALRPRMSNARGRLADATSRDPAGETIAPDLQTSVVTPYRPNERTDVEKTPGTGARWRTPSPERSHPQRPAARMSIDRLGALAAWAFGCLLLPLLTIQAKRAIGGSNIDDFLYSRVTLQLGSPLHPRGWLEAVLQTGYVSPLVPALTSVTTIDSTPYMSSVVQVAFLSLLFWSGRGIATHLGEPHPTLWALISSVFPSMLAWVAMFNFAVASSALLAACVWAYLASHGLTKWRPTLLFGLALGALTLSRSVALVYVAALALALVWHLLRQSPGLRSVWGLAGAGVVALVVAGPWWLVSGPTVLTYLIGAGYDTGSGFAPDESLFGRVATRVSHTFAEWGWPVVVALALLATLWIISVAYEHKRPMAKTASDKTTRDTRRMLLLLSVVGIAMLASSSNSGTGFSLPFAPLLLLAAGAGSVGLRRRWPPRLALSLTSTLAALTMGLSALATHLATADATRLASSWHSLLHNAGWDEGDTGPEDVHRSVVTALAGHDVLVLRDDALLNIPGLIFTSTYVGPSVGEITTIPYGDAAWVPTAADLDGAIVLSGHSPASYHRLNTDTVASALEELGYAIACETRLGHQNDIVLWAPREIQISCPDPVRSSATP